MTFILIGEEVMTFILIGGGVDDVHTHAITLFQLAVFGLCGHNSECLRLAWFHSLACGEIPRSCGWFLFLRASQYNPGFAISGRCAFRSDQWIVRTRFCRFSMRF